MHKHMLIETDGPELTGNAVAPKLVVANGLPDGTTAMTAYKMWPIAHTCHGAAAVPFDAYEKAAEATTSKAFSGLAIE